MEIFELVEFFVYLFAELLWPLVSALFRGIGWLLRGAFDLGRHLARQLVKRLASPIPKAIAHYRARGQVASNVQAFTTAARDASSSNTPTMLG